MKFVTVIVAVMTFAVIGCDMNKVDPGGGASSQTVVTLRGEAGPAETVAVKTVVKTQGPPGTLVGRVVLDGVVPALGSLVPQNASPVDPTVCAKEGAIPDQSFEASSDGGVANVFIYLAKTPKGVEFDDPKEQEVLDQKICIFKPHGVVWRAGFPFQLKNSDKVTHNVQMLTAKNGTPNNTMPPATDSMATFKKSEPQPFQAKCAIHPWMSFYALVVDHPFAAVTDDQGNFKIPNLPAGEHTFRVWHERGKMMETKLKVVVKPAPEETKLELKYDTAKFGL